MPHWCKIAGLILFGLVVVYWISLWIYAGCDSYALGRLIAKMLENNSFASGDVIVLLVSTMMMAFSREKDEDEYVASMRGRYLTIAFYVDFVFLFIALLIFHDMNSFVQIAAWQMFMVLWLHIVMFNIAMAVIRNRNKKEAQL